MAFSIADIIKQQVSSAAGGIQIPANVQNQVLGGLSDSILGSLTQTATSKGGINVITDLLTGKTSAAKSPVTSLAGSLFTKNILKNLNLGSATNSALTGLIPTVLGGVTKLFKDQNGDGKVDINDVIIALGGKIGGGGLFGSLLGGLFGRR
ncbi:MAG: hypothetical protein IJ840_07100 [Bacteroidales bacterium]|nr:hypothetical protein [Bacteroidales bacterium]